MKVTEVSAQKKNNRFNLFVDGKFWFGISDRVLAKYNLYKDKEVDEKLLGQVIQDEISTKLYDRCIGKISRRPHSVYELKVYMNDIFYKKRKNWFDKTDYEGNSKEIEVQIRDVVIKKLEDQGLLSDEEFARWWVESRKKFKPRGWFTIKQELANKGVSNDIINSVALSNDDQYKMAQAIFRKAFGRKKNIKREKVISKLKSRGFDWDTISGILQENGL